jgi:hypothetical protein
MSDHDYDLGSPRCRCDHSQRSHDDVTGECYTHPTFLGEPRWLCRCGGFEEK